MPLRRFYTYLPQIGTDKKNLGTSVTLVLGAIVLERSKTREENLRKKELGGKITSETINTTTDNTLDNFGPGMGGKTNMGPGQGLRRFGPNQFQRAGRDR